MRSFILKSNDGRAFNFDTKGGVSSPAGAAVGTWTTNNQNQIVFNPTVGAAPVAFTPAWKFDQNNELSLTDSQGNPFSFTDSDYELEHNALQVRTLDGLEFELYPVWSVDASNNLAAKIGEAESSIQDCIFGDAGTDLTCIFMSGEAQELIFEGGWENAGQPAGQATDTLHLTFSGKVPNAGEFKLSLNGAQIEANPDHLLLSYTSTQGVQTIKAVGSLKIELGPDKTVDLTFQFMRRTGNGLVPTTTEIKIGAQFHLNDTSGTLELAVKDAAGRGQTFAVAGTLRHEFQNNGLLTLSYDLEAGTGVGQSLAIAVDGSFENKEFVVKFSAKYSAGEQDFSITLTDKNSKFAIGAGVKIKNDTHGRSVIAFLSLDF